MRILSAMSHRLRSEPIAMVVGISILLCIALFLRTWRLPDTVQFLGDQGRDALLVSRIFRQHDLVFIGPVTSVGNMYLGPLYYYFMLPFLWLSYPSPLGPVYAVALLGVAAIAAQYFLGKELIGRTPALIGAFFLTFSYLAIEYSRFSWNPNPAPLVSLIMIWATYRAWTKSSWYWIVVSVCFSILIQLHYLTLLSAAGAGVIWLTSLRELYTQKSKTHKNALTVFFAATAISAVIFLLSLTPLILFDLKHQWLNVRAFSNLLTGEDAFSATNVKLSLPMKLAKTALETHGRSMHILFEIAIGKDRILNTLLAVTTISLLISRLIKNRHSKTWHGETVLSAYLFTGIIGTSFYQHSVFHHYIAYLWPVTFLVYGIGIKEALNNKITSLLVLLFTAYFLSYNISHYPLKPIGLSIKTIQSVSQTISSRVKPGEKYNIVLLSETGDIDGQNYRYFLEATDTPPLPTERRGEVETLFIINEDRKLKKVVDSPIYEIVVFPNKQPAEVYTLENGTEITVLRVHPDL